MRILTVHNFYGSDAPSGENTAYCGERDLLRHAGCEVAEFTRHSDEIRGRGVAGALRGGLSTPWNPWSAQALAAEVRRFRPDVVHVHNTFPLISPAVFHALGDGPAAVVMTLHNFRTVCASAMLMRNDRICTECLDRSSVRPALCHGCYRGNRVATAPLALSIALHRALGTWQRRVDAYVTLTGFQREVFRRAGFPDEALHVKANTYDTLLRPQPWSARSDRVLFVGRIGREKGVLSLLEAWRRWGAAAPQLEVVGEGPDLDAARRFVSEHGCSARVCLRGALEFGEVQQLLAHSRLLIVPSTWFEGYPMVIREAFALGVPVAASDLGSLADLVDAAVGRRFRPSDPDDLLKVVRRLWGDGGALEAMSEAARLRYERDLAPGPNLERLMAIYASARAGVRHGLPRGRRTGALTVRQPEAGRRQWYRRPGATPGDRHRRRRLYRGRDDRAHPGVGAARREPLRVLRKRPHAGAGRGRGGVRSRGAGSGSRNRRRSAAGVDAPGAGCPQPTADPRSGRHVGFTAPVGEGGAARRVLWFDA